MVEGLINEGKFAYLVHDRPDGRCGGERQTTPATTIEEMEQTGTLIASSTSILTTSEPCNLEKGQAP
jgi:hypothetical protein